ncbi:MAG: asparagine synthase [Nitrospira bacterium SG8_35_4]|nr:MAG: asparagine synthase [Nitrospira bacterium SG8_35_4]
MCGIAGATRGMLGQDAEETLHRMNDVMVHRGPDMGDIYLDSDLGLCHRRLSIIDLSEDGRQPMLSDDGKLVIVFNGEIYNFQELRSELLAKGHTFRTGTDTEVLLYLYKEYGEASIERIRGMFAYTIWDRSEKKLFAARDRIGKKPFYYYAKSGGFAFASEIKSLLQIDRLGTDIDPTALIDYLKYLFIPHPKSIYNDIEKLEPGHYLIYKNGRAEVKQYWDVDFSDPLRSGEGEIIEELLDVVAEAVKCRMISDVPLGAFLSGGVDSSGIVALMARGVSEPVTTCSIGFDDEKHNEAMYAKSFARSLSTNHHEHYIKDEPAGIIEKLVWHFDEPFADSSMVPTYYVSNLARQNVTVALSGDGGDESFAGYEKYSIDRYENMVREFVPHPVLEGIARITNSFQSGLNKRLNSLCSSAALSPAEGFYVTNTFITDVQLKSILTNRIWQEVMEYDPAAHMKRYFNSANGRDHLSKILYADLKLYLPGDILVKVDRMSMANSLEVRSPLLDHKVIEFAARIPSSLKIHRGEKKYALKKSFGKVVPQDVLNRKKHGFVVPLNSWFKNELKEMAEQSIFGDHGMEGYFNMNAIKTLWNEHQACSVSHGTLLWTLFVFSLWLQQCYRRNPSY